MDTTQIYWRIGTTGKSGTTKRRISYWKEMLENKYASIGWAKIGDLAKWEVDNERDIKEQDIKELLIRKQHKNNAQAGQSKGDIFNFCKIIKKGDILLASKGQNVLGIGIVKRNDYEFLEDKNFAHTQPVEWLIPDCVDFKQPEGYRKTFTKIKNPNTINSINKMLSKIHNNPSLETAVIDNDTFAFQPPFDKNNDSEKSPHKYISKRKEIEIKFIHEAISKKLTEYLGKEVFGRENVTPNHPAGYGANKIDIVVQDIQDNKNLIFYEIKTYDNLISSIREALGQILEYSLWPDKNKAKELIIVTQPLPDTKKAIKYFQHLRDLFGIPLYYQSFDYEKGVLSEKY